MRRPQFAFVVTLTSSLVLAHVALAGINFVGAPTNSAPPSPEFMVTGDLNADGRTDVIVVSPRSAEVDIYLAADTPSFFGAVQSIHVGSSPQRPAVGDVNGDTRLDLVIPDLQAGSVWILLGKGDGTFLTPYRSTVTDSRRPSAVAIGNFDDLGNADLAVTDERLDEVFILRNDNGTPPRFLAGGVLLAGDKPDDIRSVDLNGDGHLDLLTLNLGGPRVKDLSVLLWKRAAQGFPEFEPVQKYTIGENPSQMVLADFNHDGRVDVALLNRPVGLPNGMNIGEVQILLTQPNGVLFGPNTFQVPCPFFVPGATCKLLTLAAGDFDGNGNVDIAVGVANPVALSVLDAMQIFGGSENAVFTAGPVVQIGKVPVSMAVGNINTDGKLDIAIANQRTLDLQAFINVSTPGDLPNGTMCLLGDECLSDRCTNGFCCASQCDAAANEACNIPGREGSCVPIPPVAVSCDLPGECLATQFCVDNFCCDQLCTGGHCDRDGFQGVCIPGIADGQPCSGDGSECSSNFCSENFVCCREECLGGFCDTDGVCHLKAADGEDCTDNTECLSNVCDEFDRICCNRVCTEEEVCFPDEGMCRPFDYTPAVKTPTPTVPPTATPRLTPAPTGELCTIPNDCQNSQCVNGVCCSQSSCPTDQHCEQGSGECVAGAAGSPTATRSPTPLPTLPTPNPCGVCPSGSTCQIVNGDPLCISKSTSGGCSTVGDEPAAGNLVVIGLLPLTLWASRRWQLRRARLRARAPRQ